MARSATQERFAIFDKWKILIDPRDRSDFEVNLYDLQISSFTEGKLKGIEEEQKRMAQLEAARELPLERGKTSE
jgi:hypothetical protein